MDSWGDWLARGLTSGYQQGQNRTWQGQAPSQDYLARYASNWYANQAAPGMDPMATAYQGGPEGWDDRKGGVDWATWVPIVAQGLGMLMGAYGDYKAGQFAEQQYEDQRDDVEYERERKRESAKALSPYVRDYWERYHGSR